MFDDSLQQLRADTGRWGLQGADALDLATHYARDKGPMQTQGFAAAHALTRCLMDRAGFIESLRAGKSHSSFSVKFALTPENYPGFESLLWQL